MGGKKVIRKISTLFTFLLFCSTLLFAANTGKIDGTVVDAETGDPLYGANIVIDGTSQGAAADADGYFYIINVDPGQYTLLVSMVGYKTIRKEQVNVGIDRTTTLKFTMQPTSIMGEEVVIVAEREAVKRDVSQSEINVTSDQIEDVPLVKDVNQFIRLQAGVRTGEDGEMLIRGGGMDQVGMVVDGLNMTNNVGGGPVDIINLSAVKQVSIIKGGFNAEYGNIRSGLFNIVTKDAQKTAYNGSVDMRFTPAHQKHRGANLYSWDNYWVRPYVDPAVAYVGTKNGSWDKYTQGQYREFEGWDKFTQRLNNDEDPENDLTPDEARNLYIWQHALEGSGALGHPHEGKYGDKPDWDVDASFSGPLPFISEYLGNLRFFASYRYNIDQYTYPQQLDGTTNNNWMVKLNADLSSSMKIGVEALSGRQKVAAAGGGEFDAVADRGAYFPYGSTPMDIDTRVYGLTFDHVLGQNTFYNFRFSVVQVENNANKWRTLRDTTTLRYFGSIPVDEQPYGFLNDPGYVYAIADEMVIGGVGGDYINQDKITTFNAKFDITSQIDKYNQVQAGVEFIYDHFNIYEAADGFDPTGNYENEWDQSPYRLQAYVQDKLEFKGFVANLGVRMDYNNPNSIYYGVDPYSRYFSRVYKYQLATDAPTDDAEAKLTFSPRLGISHPITEKSKLYFNYGHFYDQPSAYNRFQIDYGVASAGIESVGNPNLKPRRTIAYELGYEQEIADMFLIRLTGYYRDITNEIGDVRYINYDESVSYTTFANDHYADVRGFEVELRKDWGDWVTGWLNYTLMVQTDGFVGREEQYQDPRLQAQFGRRNPIVEKPLPRPYANANVRFMTPEGWGPTIGDYPFLEELSLNFLVSWQTGEYLTWEPLPPYKAQNNLQWKDRWNVDLRISKFFTVSDFEFNVFADIVNVFDLQYLTGGGFGENNDFRDYMNSLHLPMYGEAKYKDDPRFTAGDDQVGDVRTADKPYINMPNLDFLAWNPPRSVVLGVRIGF